MNEGDKKVNFLYEISVPFKEILNWESFDSGTYKSKVFFTSLGLICSIGLLT